MSGKPNGPMSADDVLSRCRFLVDTNVISAVIGKKPVDAGLHRFFGNVAEERMYLSVVTIGEIRKGIDLIRWPKNAEAIAERRRLQAHWEQRLGALCDRFAGRVIEIDLPVAHEWGRLEAELQRVGRPVSVSDSLIASCAVRESLVIATMDSDFNAFAHMLTMYNPRTHAVSGLAKTM